MTFKKRLIASVLALVMAFGVMVFSSSAAETPAAITPAPLLTGDEIGLSKYDPPITISRAIAVDPNTKFAPGQSYENNIWTTEYREVLGINLETAWEAEGSQGYEEKLNLSIVSGNIPDVFSCNRTQFTSLLKAGLLEDLTDVLDEYGTEFYKENLMADGGISMDQASVQGRLYGLPKNIVLTGAYQFVYIRDDWRQNLELPEPKTLDDLLVMAKAFSEKDPDGNGIDDTYGIAISNQPYETWFAVRGIFNSFGAFPMIWIEKDGKLEYGDVQPEMKTALAAMHQWYEDGLFDLEFVTKDSMAVSAEAIAGNVGIAFAEGWLLGWPLPDATKAGHKWRAYPIPFDESAPEKKLAAKQELLTVFVARKGIEHPEALVKMCNLFQERVMSMNYDTTIYKNDDEYNYEGLAAFQPVNGYDRNRRMDYLLNIAIPDRDPSILENVDQENRYKEIIEYIDGTVTFEENVDRYALDYLNYWSRYGEDSLYGITLSYEENDMYKIDKYNAGPTPAMQEFGGQLQSDAEEMMLNIITGIEDIDYFDTFVETWYANGGEQITQEVNDWYAAQ